MNTVNRMELFGGKKEPRTKYQEPAVLTYTGAAVDQRYGADEPRYGAPLPRTVELSSTVTFSVHVHQFYMVAPAF